MRKTLLAASFAALLLEACASSGLRYVDGAGREYPGTIDPVRYTMTAQIGAKLYRGPFTVKDWSQAKATLTSPGADPLYCDFQYQVLKVKGTCTDLAGGDYSMQSR